MSDALNDWLARFKDDPKVFADELRDPVLWIEHVDDEPLSEDDRSLHTQSGLKRLVQLGAAPRLLVIRKMKDNAFARGITVGRTQNNDLVIDDPSVSRFHAWFQLTAEGRWSVADAGSKNGTYVSTKKLPTRKAELLEGGEKVRFGDIAAYFLTPERVLERLRRRSG